MWVKAGPPFTSPRAYTPGALVSSRSFASIKPRLSVSMPAASRLRVSVLGGLPAATRRCAFQRALPLGCVYRQKDFPGIVLSGASGLGPQQDLDTVLAQDLSDRFGNVGVLAAHQLSTSLYDRDLAAETPEHLGELHSDVAAAEHEQVLRQLVELHDGGRVQG